MRQFKWTPDNNIVIIDGATTYVARVEEFSYDCGVLTLPLVAEKPDAVREFTITDTGPTHAITHNQAQTDVDNFGITPLSYDIYIDNVATLAANQNLRLQA